MEGNFKALYFFWQDLLQKNIKLVQNMGQHYPSLLMVLLKRVKNKCSFFLLTGINKIYDHKNQ